MAEGVAAPAPTTTPVPSAPAQPAGPVRIPDFEVVPLKLLAFPALVVAGLLTAMFIDELWPLMFMHVVFGAAWTIIDLFMGFVIGPILGRLGPQAQTELTVRLMPKMVVILPTIVTATLAAGWQLGMYLGTVQSDHPLHGWVVASYIVVGIMAVVALGLLEPANIAVLLELKKKHPNPEIIQRLMMRFVYAAGITGLMQIATLVIMVKLRAG